MGSPKWWRGRGLWGAAGGGGAGPDRRGHSLDAFDGAALGARAAIWGKAGRRRAELSKNNNNGWCFLEAVLERKERIGHRGVVKSGAAVKGYFFLEGFFFKGL